MLNLFLGLVRNSEKGAKVAKDYASVKLVYGDLDSSDMIEEESKNADIVLSKLFINMSYQSSRSMY